MARMVKTVVRRKVNRLKEPQVLAIRMDLREG